MEMPCESYQTIVGDEPCSNTEVKKETNIQAIRIRCTRFEIDALCSSL